MRYRAPHLYVEGHPTLSKGELLVIFAILVLSKNPCFGLLLNSLKKWPTQYQLGRVFRYWEGLIFPREQEHFPKFTSNGQLWSFCKTIFFIFRCDSISSTNPPRALCISYIGPRILFHLLSGNKYSLHLIRNKILLLSPVKAMPSENGWTYLHSKSKKGKLSHLKHPVQCSLIL